MSLAQALAARLEVEELAAHAAGLSRQVEDDRRLPASTAALISRAGFPAHFVPERFGGTAGTFTQLVDAVADLAAHCTSTAWCAALFAAHGRLAAYLPARVQEQIWEGGPHTRIAAAVVPPQGSVKATEGGWRLSGSWRFASGVDLADWLLVAGRTGTQHRIFALPAAGAALRDTWHHLGLRGTGSNQVDLTDLFVPSWATMTLDDLAVPHPDPHAARCHQVPFSMVAAAVFAAPAVGAAAAAVGEWAQQISGRTGPAASLSPGGRVGDALLRSSGEADAARMLLRAAARRADRVSVTPAAVAQCRRDAVLAADWSVTAVERVVRAAGARGHGADTPLVRRWRDIHAVAGHAALDLDAAADAYLRAAMA